MLPTLPLLRIEQTTFSNVIQGMIKYDMYYQLLLSLSKAKVQTIAFLWKNDCSSISTSLPVQIFNQVLWCGWVLHFIAYDCISSLDFKLKSLQQALFTNWWRWRFDWIRVISTLISRPDPWVKVTGRLVRYTLANWKPMPMRVWHKFLFCEIQQGYRQS